MSVQYSTYDATLWGGVATFYWWEGVSPTKPLHVSINT